MGAAAFVARGAMPRLSRTPSTSDLGAVQLMAPAGAPITSLLNEISADLLLAKSDAAMLASTTLLAKSEADELIEEIFINLPTAVVGFVLAFSVIQYAKSFELDDGGVFGIIFKDYFVFLAVPTFAVLFVLAGKLGVLSTGSGILAKVALDGWNVFAGLLLPGAVLAELVHLRCEHCLGRSSGVNAVGFN